MSVSAIFMPKNKPRISLCMRILELVPVEQETLEQNLTLGEEVVEAQEWEVILVRVMTTPVVDR